MGETNPDLSASARNPMRTFAPTERIKELNDIDASIAQLLCTAGEALQTLGCNSPATNLSTAKSQFLDSVTSYFTVLSSIDVRLRRQVYALQEAGLIAEGDAKDAKKGASAAGAVGAGVGVQSDVSWLNGRGDEVERDMEREAWKRAREFVERLVGEGNGDRRIDNHLETENSEGDEKNDKEEIMEKKDV
jgi:Mediator complex protein